MEGLAGATIGSYRLIRHLGSGGYGEIFLAQKPTNTGNNAPLVVKALRADAPDGAISALMRSAETLATAGHAHHLPIYEAGIDGSAAFIAMPYLPLGSVETLLDAHLRARSGGVAPALVAPLITQVSRGLGAAHALGIAHGDLKPGNIFLQAEPGSAPLALVSDFGQAPLVQAAMAGAYPISPNARISPLEVAERLTAPEQFSGAPTPQSDQFALAAITCLLLTGRYPQDQAATRGQRHLPRGASALSDTCALLLPASVVSVAQRALAMNPAERYPDIAAFASALDAGLADAKAISFAAPRQRVPSRAVAAAPPAPSAASASAEPSYAPTGIALLDTLLARTDDLTHGKAGLLQRAFTYICIGGFAAVVNLVTLYLVYNVATLPFSPNIHWFIAFVIAAEVSTMTNFVLNDRITFSRLPGHARSWGARCLRFHSTSLAGTIATLVLSFAFKTWLGMSAIIAEAIAIIIALALNFTMHHLWTYRHVEVDDHAHLQESLVAQEVPARR